MSGSVLVECDGAIATVTLCNPEKMNALTLDMWRELGAAMTALSTQDALRCVVLRGAGEQAFAAGADVLEFAALRSNAEQARHYGAVTHAAMDALAACRHPTVAMIHGVCVGGGLEIASVCDLRICGAGSRFGVPVNKLGLVMSYGELKALVNLTGAAVAREIVLEGRVFGAQEAFAKGLVTRVVPDAEVAAETDSTARRVAAGAPLVARWHKQFIRRLEDARPWNALELGESNACFDTEDYRIGYAAFAAKAKPTFIGK
ncbi:MAG TPA: enoyl-CoA hydratase-related protein [Telluria sp.]|nr:enoyl-CoA hydratase-related protein [Telluria sp.]